jgi:hypothetical protein
MGTPQGSDAATRDLLTLPHVPSVLSESESTDSDESDSSESEFLGNQPHHESTEPSELLSFEEEEEAKYVANLLAREKERKKKKKKISGRQGRSHESRERSRQNNILYKQNPTECYPKCPDCGNENLIEDERTADLICPECAIVCSSDGLTLQATMRPHEKKSKPYQSVVHYRQRRAQLMGKDPVIPKRIRKKLITELFLLDHKELQLFGKKTLSRILTKLKLPRRYAANWLQLRRRFGLDPLPIRFTNDDVLWTRMNLRYTCIAKAFAETLSREKALPHVPKSLIRKNIVNVNYTFLQLLRLETDDALEHFGIFFPQLCSKEQPAKNNRRWKYIIDYCNANFKRFSCVKTDVTYQFDWNYLPLTQPEIKEHCTYFN